MGLATGGLPISKYGGVLSLQQLFDVNFGDSIVHFLLGGELTTDAIEAELVAAVIHHCLVVLESRGLAGLEPTEHPNLGGVAELVVSLCAIPFLQPLHLDDLVHQVDRYLLALAIGVP